VGKEYVQLTDQERSDYRKVMQMIFRKDGHGRFLVDDLVRENQEWETNQRWMKSIFNLVKKPKREITTKDSLDKVTCL
jgi:hypothetical protein